MNNIFSNNQRIVNHPVNNINSNILQKTNPASILMTNVPNALVEYYFYFLSIRDIKRLGLVNKSFHIKSEASHLWKNLYQKFSQQNIAYQNIHSLDGATDKSTVQRIYEDKKLLPTKLRAIFSEFEYIMALPLISLDNKTYGKKWALNQNSSVVEAMRFAPTLSKITVHADPKLDLSSWIAIKLNAHIKNPLVENKEDVVSGVCVIWKQLTHSNWTISFNWLTLENQSKFNPSLMDELRNESQVDWFKRLLQGQKCGDRMFDDEFYENPGDLFNKDLDDPTIETFDDLYFTIQPNE